jgi:hypothetical protein
VKKHVLRELAQRLVNAKERNFGHMQMLEHEAWPSLKECTF